MCVFLFIDKWRSSFKMRYRHILDTYLMRISTRQEQCPHSLLHLCLCQWLRPKSRTRDRWICCSCWIPKRTRRSGRTLRDGSKPPYDWNNHPLISHFKVRVSGFSPITTWVLTDEMIRFSEKRSAKTRTYTQIDRSFWVFSPPTLGSLCEEPPEVKVETTAAEARVDGEDMSAVAWGLPLWTLN